MDSNRSITDHSITLPSVDELVAVLTLSDYNTRVVVLGVSFLGLAAGVVGSFMLLRKRALLGDALSHATLPGIGLAFIFMAVLGAEGKSLPALLAGATITGVLGIACILLITNLTRIKEDASLGIVLSVFFGAGVTITSLIQSMNTAHAAGLKSFIYGKTASMLFSDAAMIAITAVIVTVLCAALFKEFTVLCFDPSYARAQGWPILWLDVLMLAIVVTVTVIGLQAVGLILMIALLVIPAAAARFWTDHLPTMLVAAGGIGAASGYFGAALSALVPRLPAGAIIVLVAACIFGLSLLCGPARGVLRRLLEQMRLERKISRQHLLRAMYELAEEYGDGALASDPPAEIPLLELQAARSWSAGRLASTLRAAQQNGLVIAVDTGKFRLTNEGVAAAWRAARNHRLWELFMITHADIAPSHVDRDADMVEHVLEPAMIAELEVQLAEMHPDLAEPRSPHQIDTPRRAATAERSE